MADIRINALATTAASTASDDFVAVDGSANGTRKLNAYSPTFGGNLTVSGTGTHTFGTTNTVTIAAGKISTTGKVGIGTTAHPNLQLTVVQPTANAAALWTESVNTLGQSHGVIINAGTNASDFGLVVRNAAQTDMFKVDGASNATLSGNLTVSGTGNNVFRGPIRWGNTNFPGNNGYISEASTNSGLFPAIARNLIGSTGSNYTIADGAYGYYSGFEFSNDIRWFANSGTFTTGQSVVPTERMRLTYTGNLLLKSDGVDSGNGKLQLADHTNSAGGIGFGTDTAIFRTSNGRIAIDALSASTVFLELNLAGGKKGEIAADASNVYIGSAVGGLNTIIRSGAGTTALTLDSSQRTFTASAAKIGSLTGTVDSRLHVYESTAVSTSNGLTLEQASTGDSLISFLLTGVQRWSVGIDNSDSDKFKIGTGDLGAADKFTVDTSGNATVAGAIAIGNTVQTASGVASTHKVTISIGGSTYYLLATNV